MTDGFATLLGLAVWARWLGRPMSEAEASDFEFLVVGVTTVATGIGAFLGAVFGLVLVWLLVRGPRLRSRG
jgi:hypothetical protein